MVFMSSGSKKGSKVSFKYNKRRCVTVNSHSNNNKTNKSKTSNSDNIIGNSKLRCFNLHTQSSLNKLIYLQK